MNKIYRKMVARYKLVKIDDKSITLRARNGDELTMELDENLEVSHQINIQSSEFTKREQKTLEISLLKLNFQEVKAH